MTEIETSTLKKNLSVSAYEEIKNLIVIGKFTQRERIMESKLAQQLKISRTPIREAVRMLEKDGLVSRDSMGAYITALSKAEAKDIYKVRIELEELGVRLAMENGTSKEFTQLEKILEELETMSEDDTVSKVIAVNSLFHSHLADMSHNFYLKHTLHDIRTRLCLVRASAIVATKRRLVAVEQHTEIGRAMLAGETAKAIALTRKHSEDAAEAAISNLYD